MRCRRRRIVARYMGHGRRRRLRRSGPGRVELGYIIDRLAMKQGHGRTFLLETSEFRPFIVQSAGDRILGRVERVGIGYDRRRVIVLLIGAVANGSGETQGAHHHWVIGQEPAERVLWWCRRLFVAKYIVLGSRTFSLGGGVLAMPGLGLRFQLGPRHGLGVLQRNATTVVRRLFLEQWVPRLVFQTETPGPALQVVRRRGVGVAASCRTAMLLLVRRRLVVLRAATPKVDGHSGGKTLTERVDKVLHDAIVFGHDLFRRRTKLQ